MKSECWHGKKRFLSVTPIQQDGCQRIGEVITGTIIAAYGNWY